MHTVQRPWRTRRGLLASAAARSRERPLRARDNGSARSRSVTVVSFVEPRVNVSRWTRARAPMADFERLIPAVDGDDGPPRRPGQPAAASRSSSFSRLSLSRFSQRLRRRGWTVAADDGDQDKENRGRPRPPPPVAAKRVKFDKRVYLGPVRDRPCRTAAVRGILKTPAAEGSSSAGYACCDDAVPNRMRMYDVPVTSFYIGAGEHLQLMPPRTAKRCSPGAARQTKKTCRRFGTEIGSWLLRW